MLLFTLLFSSDEFIQAQQQLVRWASEEAVGNAGPNSDGTQAHHQREYYPSPSASSEESDESGGETNSIARAPPKPPRHDHDATLPSVGPTVSGTTASGNISSDQTSGQGKRYPEYKH